MSNKSMFGKFAASCTVAITVGDGPSHEVECWSVERTGHAHDVTLHYVSHGYARAFTHAEVSETTGLEFRSVGRGFWRASPATSSCRSATAAWTNQYSQRSTRVVRPDQSQVLLDDLRRADHGPPERPAFTNSQRS